MTMDLLLLLLRELGEREETWQLARLELPLSNHPAG